MGRAQRAANKARAEGKTKKRKMKFTRLDEDGEEEPQTLMEHLEEHYPVPADVREAMARAAEAQVKEEDAAPVVFNKRRSDKAGFRRKKPGGL